jgi:TonB family protein
MKRTMLAILALSPVALQAQVKTPAQPGSTPVLQSSNVQPAVFAAVKSSDTVATATTLIRVSTGVTPPTLIHSVNVDTNHILQVPMGEPQDVTVDMVVDENGKPSNVKVVKSADMFTDRGVVSAVNQFRYKPATLNGSPVPMAVTLQFTIE